MKEPDPRGLRKGRCVVEALGAPETTHECCGSFQTHRGKGAPEGEQREVNLQSKCAEQFVGGNLMSMALFSAEDPGGCFFFW